MSEWRRQDGISRVRHEQLGHVLSVCLLSGNKSERFIVTILRKSF